MHDTAHISNAPQPHYKEARDPYELQLLIADCIAESRAAQQRMYDLFAPGAYGVIKRYFYKDEAAAQEILNDSFYKVLTKLSLYSFQGAFEGWIRRIVVNTITDYLRKNLRDEYQHKEVQPEDAFVQSESVEKISHKELLQLIQALPDIQRAVFNLFVMDDCPHKEIGAALNISENNSRWYLNDARKRLKEKISFINK